MERSVALTVLIVFVCLLVIIALIIWITNNSNDAFVLPLLPFMAKKLKTRMRS